jgi:hypothetical protein
MKRILRLSLVIGIMVLAANCKDKFDNCIECMGVDYSMDADWYIAYCNSTEIRIRSNSENYWLNIEKNETKSTSIDSVKNYLISYFESKSKEILDSGPCTVSGLKAFCWENEDCCYDQIVRYYLVNSNGYNYRFTYISPDSTVFYENKPLFEAFMGSVVIN